MSKQVAEQSHKLSIFWLKKNGYLKHDYIHNCGGISWTNGFGDTKNSIGFTVVVPDLEKPQENAYIELDYSFTNHQTDEKENMKYKISLVATPCNYGGFRYWFVCPLSKNGQYCGRRVGSLFQIGKYFGCRHCGEIAYQSQMETERYKGFISIPDIEEAEKKVKRYYYRGIPTKSHQKLIRLNDKFRWQMIKSAAEFDPKYKRIVDLLKK